MKIYITALLISLIAVYCTPTKKTAKPPEKIATPPAAYFNGIVIRDNINVRSTFSTDASIVGKVNDGEQVQVLQNKNGWYEIVTNEKLKGWVRSDFVGPKSMSYNLRAENFADSMLNELNVDMFIDENNPYSVIYMVLPEEYYNDKKRAVNFVEQLGIQYQQEVYPGKVEIRILEKDTKTIFDRISLSKQGAVNLKAPYLATGRPYSFELVKGQALVIKVLVPAGLSDDMLYDMSSKIAANYGNDITKIEIYFIEDNADGMAYLNNVDSKRKKNNSCRFYYLEDKNGPYFEANFCN